MALTKTHSRMIAGATVNAIDFGAVGDGVTDSAAAIQAALDSLDGVGGTVYLPAGTYACSTQISLGDAQSLLGPETPTFKDTSDGMAVLLFTNDTDGIAYTSNSYRNGLYNIVVKSNLTLGTSTGVGVNFNISGTGTFALANEIRNVAIVGFDTGLYAGDAGDFSWFQKADNLKIDNCKIGVVLDGSNGASEFNSIHINSGNYWGTASRGIVIQEANGVTLTNLSIEKCFYGIDWQEDNENSRIYVFGAYFEATGSREINMSGAGQVYITGVRFAFTTVSNGYVFYSTPTSADNGKVILIARDIQLQTTSGGNPWNRLVYLQGDEANTICEVHDVFLNGNINGLFDGNAPDYLSLADKDKAGNRVDFIKRNATNLMARTVRSDYGSAPSADTFVFDKVDGTTIDLNYTNSVIEYANYASTLARRIWNGSAWVDHSYT